MIARHESTTDRNDLWAKLAAKLPEGVVQWRQDGRPIQRGDQFFARFVAFVDANTVRERLDSVVPGEWDLTLELLPSLAGDDTDETRCSFKARLQILGVIREDVGHGKDYKQAATDAFKRCAVRFGIAHELYDYEQNWVRVDSDGRYAKPLEDPADAYARRIGSAVVGEPGGKASGTDNRDWGHGDVADSMRGRETASRAQEGRSVEDSQTGNQTSWATDEPSCPKCGGWMWDNRLSKRNPKAPDFKCRSRSCDGVVWPPRPESLADFSEAAPARSMTKAERKSPKTDHPHYDDSPLPGEVVDGLDLEPMPDFPPLSDEDFPGDDALVRV